MKVSLDGGITYHDAKEGVRVIYGLHDDLELHVNLTREGVILDGWKKDENVGTSSATTYDLVERLL